MNNTHSINKQYDWQKLNKYLPLTLFVFAFLLRLGLVFTLKTYSSPFHFSEHVQIANSILIGEGYSFNWYGLGAAGEGSFMPPVYVGIVVLATITFPIMPWLAIQIFQALLSASTVMLLYFIGKYIFAESVGIIASVLLAVYPPSLGYVLDIQSLTVEAFLVTLVIFTSIYWRKYTNWKFSFALGSALGLAVLSRSNLILLLPLLFIWMILSHRRRGLIHFIITTGILTLILGPWVLRNYLVHENFVFVSTNGGFTLFQGNNINATGVAYPHMSNVWKQYPELGKELTQLNEAARDKRLYQESITFIRTHPDQAFWLALKKLIYFWWFKPGFIQGGVISGYPWYFGLFYMGSYTILLGFSIFGFVSSFEEYKDLFIFYALFLTQTFVAMIFIAGMRHRGILEPLLIVLAAYGIARILPKLASFLVPNAVNWGPIMNN